MSFRDQHRSILPQLRTAFLAFPRMPLNDAGFSNGDIIRCETDDLRVFARRGQEFPIFYDGQFIRCLPPKPDGSNEGPAWEPEQLRREIQENKWWSVCGSLFKPDQ